MNIFFLFLVLIADLCAIDHIYLINLDHRKDRLEKSLKQLAPYGLIPHRFAAIYGKNLSVAELSRVALKLEPFMEKHKWSRGVSKGLKKDFLRKEVCGKPFFSEWMTIGAVGCALSHLSVLKEAYDLGYETIWVLEDDFVVKEDPHKLNSLIEKLDALTDSSWDVLYTDQDEGTEEDISPNLWFMWRPDHVLFDMTAPIKRSKISEDFIKIGSRSRTHSMLIRRSGMKKILDHFNQHHLYLPYDHEIALVRDIQLYMLTYPVVTWSPDSDTDIQR